MADQNFNSDNIDDYRNFDFTQLGDNEIEVSEQQNRSFPLTMISQKNGFLNIVVCYEVYLWDHWIRNHSIKRFEKAFFNSFTNTEIEGVDEVKAGIFEEDEEKILLTWDLKLPLTRSQEKIKTIILKSVDLVLYQARLQLNEPNLSSGLKKYFLINGNSYTISTGIFWVAFPIVCGFAFFLGTIKYDADKISMVEDNKALQDTIKIRENTIKYLRHNSDSALNILSHMPYSQMRLDSNEFRKVQTNIENVGAALYLNK
jgi:hypothetical protein